MERLKDLLSLVRLLERRREERPSLDWTLEEGSFLFWEGFSIAPPFYAVLGVSLEGWLVKGEVLSLGAWVSGMRSKPWERVDPPGPRGPLKPLPRLVETLEEARRRLREAQDEEKTPTALHGAYLEWRPTGAGELVITGGQDDWPSERKVRRLGATADGWRVVLLLDSGVINGWSFVEEDALYLFPPARPSWELAPKEVEE